jgi:hypothetical protein
LLTKYLLSDIDSLFFNKQRCRLARFKQIGHCSLKFKKQLMKKLLLVMSAAVFMVACTSNPTANIETAAKATTADTAGLAAFNAAKAAQALAAAAPVTMVAASEKAAPKVRTVTRYVPVKQATAKRYSSNRSIASASSGNAAPVVAAQPEVINSESSNAAKEKKGISKAAKGAIIGGVAGAVTGAVVNKKNRVMGAVIGGVAGAAGGAVIGRGMDKKEGRYVTPGFNANSGINANSGFNGGY